MAAVEPWRQEEWWRGLEPPPEPGEPATPPRPAASPAVVRPGARVGPGPAPAQAVPPAGRPRPGVAVVPPRPAAAPAQARVAAGQARVAPVPAAARGPAPAAPSQQGNRNAWPQVVRIFTATRLLDIQSRLRVGPDWKQSKILWIVGTHGGQGRPAQPGGQAKSTQLGAYTDPVVALDVADAILSGTYASRFSGRQALRIFGGSPKGDNGPISRILTFTYDASRQNPYVITVSHFRGRVEGNGRISPIAEAKLGEVSILLGESEARKVAYHLRAYIIPWMEAMALEEVRRAAQAAT